MSIQAGLCQYRPVCVSTGWFVSDVAKLRSLDDYLVAHIIGTDNPSKLSLIHRYSQDVCMPVVC